MRTARGFSFVELTVAAAVLLIVIGGVLTLSLPSQGLFSAQSEVADMQQRLRVAADVLSKDLLAAGAGGYGTASGGALGYSVAPILPYRTGLRNADPPGTYRTDTITIFYVARNAAVDRQHDLLAQNRRGGYSPTRDVRRHDESRRTGRR